MGTGECSYLNDFNEFWTFLAIRKAILSVLRHSALSPVTRALPLVRYRNNLDPGFGNAKHDEVWKALH